MLLNNTHDDEWEVLMKPAKRAKVGTEVVFGDGQLRAIVTKELEHGGRMIEFKYDGIFMQILEALAKCHCHHTSRKN